MKLVTIISGVILTLTGIYCIIRSGTTYAAMAFVLGIAMLIHGVMSIASCATEKRQGYASGYVLADGAVTLVLSVPVLANLLATEAVVPIFFGMWLLFSGTMHALQAIVVKGFGERNWRLGLTFGLLAAVVGISCFARPITGKTATVLLLGIYFIAQGISVTVLGLHFKKHTKRLRRKEAE
ncbi:HdeD family acid-resistance protein [Bacilliculturomica massiliensis]|uniref:HdeD family acid-resistance protein n=1 Tax=Bacilliculturomica massiliensis TaxID=1917867 RepID=UPI0010322197|nr:DUF308 domain-containing protein [Bacilliculturomica massiliensis]